MQINPGIEFRGRARGTRRDNPACVIGDGGPRVHWTRASRRRRGGCDAMLITYLHSLTTGGGCAGAFMGSGRTAAVFVASSPCEGNFANKQRVEFASRWRVIDYERVDEKMGTKINIGRGFDSGLEGRKREWLINSSLM